MNVGLCEGRHVVKTNEGEEMDCYLFDVVDWPTATDEHEKVCNRFIYGELIYRCREDCNLYITGLTPLLTSFLKCWVNNQERLEMTCGDLVLWHWDTEAKQYIPQKWAVIT
tara:strand:- start:5991 stop:6323 length:333 start_codon:yes stop_codon:yes gene_type:complete